jgi:hypothetical protein
VLIAVCATVVALVLFAYIRADASSASSNMAFAADAGCQNDTLAAQVMARCLPATALNGSCGNASARRAFYWMGTGSNFYFLCVVAVLLCLSLLVAALDLLRVRAGERVLRQWRWRVDSAQFQLGASQARRDSSLARATDSSETRRPYHRTCTLCSPLPAASVLVLLGLLAVAVLLQWPQSAAEMRANPELALHLCYPDQEPLCPDVFGASLALVAPSAPSARVLAMIGDNNDDVCRNAQRWRGCVVVIEPHDYEWVQRVTDNCEGTNFEFWQLSRSALYVRWRMAPFVAEALARQIATLRALAWVVVAATVAVACSMFNCDCWCSHKRYRRNSFQTFDDERASEHETQSLDSPADSTQETPSQVDNSVN